MAIVRQLAAPWWWSMLAAFTAAQAESVSHSTDRPDLVSIVSLMASPVAGDGRVVRVRGVVTWRRGNGMIIQDDSAGIWLEVADAQRAGVWQAAGDPPATIHEGVELEVEGRVNQGGYAPNILPAWIQPLGHAEQPSPRPFDPDRFFQGADDCLRVSARGVVQGVRDDGDRWLLLTADEGRRFTVAIEKVRLGSPPEAYVDSVIRCIGVATTQFNTRGQFLAPRINVTAMSDLTIEQQPPSAAFESPRVELSELGGYRPEQPTDHRICTRGVVTYAVPGRFLYLQEGCLGLRVETPLQERHEAGDLVEVAGFINRSGFVASLSESVVRRVGREAAPVPLPIQPAAIAQVNALAAERFTIARPGDYYGCLITFGGRVIDVQGDSLGGEVLLLAGDTGVTVLADAPVFQQLKNLEPGSKVTVTGIAVPEPAVADASFSLVQPASPLRIQVLLRSAADLAVIQTPSWWKPHRLLAALAAVGAIAAIATGWIVLLKRQVGRQLSLIESQLQAKARMEERQRIARDFHDTLEQDLAGIALRMDAAAGRVKDDRAQAEFEQQRALLARLRAETRDFLWDLQDRQRIDGSLAESLAAQVAYQGSLVSVPITLSIAGTPPARIPSLVQYHLLRTAREAVANAIKHADPSRVDLRLTGDAAGVCLEVIDNGGGFDVESAESLPGHFGIRGMRERARRMGATVVIQSRSGVGTRVSIRIPRTLLQPGQPESPA